MPDNKRVDLSQDLDSLLQDVKAATEEVKLRQQKDKQKEANAAQKEQTRKQSTLIIAAAAVILLVVAYFVVFAGQDNQVAQTAPVVAPAPTPQVNMGTPQRNTSSVPTAPSRGSNRPMNVPPDSYEQPKGM